MFQSYAPLPLPLWTKEGQDGARPAPPCVLTIAGSDSGGGAGVQADLKTFMALEVYGSSVITALTAQNGFGVNGIFPVDPDFVALQLQTVLQGFPVAAAKTGMLFSAEIIQAVVQILKKEHLERTSERSFAHNKQGSAALTLVVDPVCVSQSGHRLLEDEAVQTLREELLPLADLLTPNRPEAELLSGMAIATPEDGKKACAKLLDMGAKAVLLKGGHFESTKEVTDWLVLPGHEPELLRQPKIDTDNNHGTGCTLGAAITAHLALGLPLRESIIRSQRYLNSCLRYSYNPNQPQGGQDGHGPLNHVATLLAPFAS